MGQSGLRIIKEQASTGHGEVHHQSDLERAETLIREVGRFETLGHM